MNFKSVKVASRLALSFGILIALLGAVGVIGVADKLVNNGVLKVERRSRVARVLAAARADQSPGLLVSASRSISSPSLIKDRS